MAQALVDSDLKEFIAKGFFSSEVDLSGYIQPASIDLPLGSKAYLVSHKFIPFRKNISYVIEKIKIEEFDLTKSTIFYKGHTYIIKVGTITTPKGMFAKISPKSSIGRIDVMVRAICDNSGMYDYIPEETTGELWLEITPQSFNIKVEKGIPMSQLRLFETTTQQQKETPSFIFDSDGKALSNKMFDDKLVLSLAVGEEVIGYEALPVNEVIDLKQTTLEWSKFFRSIERRKKDSIQLEKDRFYILSTKERICVPAEFCLEMVPFSHLVGELRVHYAGFFDPGFGLEGGASGVLEIRPHENLVVYDGQPICLMEIYHTTMLPQTVYGSAGNNYQGQQGPKLAKYFKPVTSPKTE